MKRVLVSGATGFIGSHLVRDLKQRGYWVRGVDIKPPEFAPFAGDELIIADLRDYPRALEAMIGIDQVYALAATMGGMGFLHGNDALIWYDNLSINLNTIQAAYKHGVAKYLFTSSACVYPEYRQMETDSDPLGEDDAYPAQPDLEYGFEKLATERIVNSYSHDYGMDIRLVRFHNVYGSESTWRGGREKAPSALCRKVAIAKLCGYDYIDVFGDGLATRTYMHISDCLEGLYRIMQSDYNKPLNLGRDESISVNDFAKLIMDVAGYQCEIRHDLTKPQGVRGRSSDNTRIKEVLGWSPQKTLREGIAETYEWVQKQVEQALKNNEPML